MVSGYGIALQFNLIDNFSDKLKKANVAVEQTGKSVRRAGRDTRQFQQNLIFAAEDAMAVYGTTGLSGVLRATSNNITMMAMALAPGSALASGLTVAAVGVGQLAMAWFTAGEEARKAEAKQKKAAAAARPVDLLKDQLAAIKEEGQFRHSLREKDKEQIQEIIDAEKNNLAINQEQRAVADQSQKQARAQLEMRRKAEKELVESGKREARASAFADQNASQQELKRIQEKIDAEQALQDTLRANLAGMESEEVLKERIAGYDESIKDLAKEREQTEHRIAIATEAQATAAEAKTKKIARNVRSAVDGSKEFAEAFMSSWAGTDGAKTETPRERASREAMERKRAQFMQTDRGMFGDRRKKEAWNIAEEQKWNVDENFRVEALRYEISDQFVSDAQKAKNRERVQPSWDTYGVEQRQASSRRMEAAGFGSDPVEQGLEDAGLQSFREFMGIHGIPEDPEQAAELRQYQMQMREKSPEYYETMESAMRKRAELEKKRQATKEERETAANTKRSNELLSQIADSLNRGPTIEVSVGGVLT